MMSRDRSIIYIARFVSMVFTPFYLPLVGLIALFSLSYLNQLPAFYRLQVLIIVYFFTILLPTFLISFYRKHQGWTLIELGHREKRMMPYVISIFCYLACVWVMRLLHIPHFMGSIVMAALAVQIICALINVVWKISTHMAAIGGMGGAIIAFAEYFTFNPTWWLALLFVISGVLGTARMILRQHTLAQVVAGFFVGFICAAISILLL